MSKVSCQIFHALCQTHLKPINKSIHFYLGSPHARRREHRVETTSPRNEDSTVSLKYKMEDDLVDTLPQAEREMPPIGPS